MMTKHTPGPWKLINVLGLCSVSAGSKYIHREHDPDKEDVANARLIAAAPELLEALVEMVEIAEAQGHLVPQARAAIVKATGEKE